MQNVIHTFKPEHVIRPRALEIVIPDTPAFLTDDFANRLFIYTGILVVGALVLPGLDDKGFHYTAKLDLSSLPRHHVFDDKPYHFITLPSPDPDHQNPQKKILWAAPVASLASIQGSNDADESFHAVDEVQVGEENDHLVLFIDIAEQGDGIGVARVSYQVNLMARRMF